MRFHKISKTKDDNFWAISANMDIRLIVHRTANSLLLCYVDHHDDAYTWASNRKIERHPKTGAAQLVEIRETVQEITIHKPIDHQPVDHKPAKVPALPNAKPLLFAYLTLDDLLDYGVPTEWLADAIAATEDTLFDLADHLPQEAAEALLELATGGQPSQPTTIATSGKPFDHPDAQRRFRVMTNHEELQRALDYPWEKWTVLLHPAQQHLIERNYSGSARISGSAGIGKTIVALHRAVFLARRPPKAQILLTTFSEALANSLHLKLDRLVGNEPDVRDRIQALSIRAIAYQLYTEAFGEPDIAEAEDVRSCLISIAKQTEGDRFPESFLWSEWKDIVDAWQLDTWEAYRVEERKHTVSVFNGSTPQVKICDDADSERQVVGITENRGVRGVVDQGVGKTTQSASAGSRAVG